MSYFLVLTQRTPTFDMAVIEPHYAFLKRLRQEGQLVAAGPFSDRSGGAYLLQGDSLQEAHALIVEDPLISSGSSSFHAWEWKVQWTEGWTSEAT